MTNGNYRAQIAWVVNLATGCDSKQTAEWNSWTATTLFYAGQCIQDSNSNTQMALITGTTKSGMHPTWNGPGVVTNDAGVNWLNLGAVTTSYGTPGLSLPSVDSSFITVSNGTLSIVCLTGGLCSPGIPAYKKCDNMITAHDGEYYTDPAQTHLFRVVGNASGSGLACNMSTTSGHQTQDSGVTTVYWQEVGPLGSSNDGSNYLKVVGYIPYVSQRDGDAGSETAQVSGCSSTITIGNLTACVLSATFRLTSDPATSGTHPPKIDTTHPLIALGERENGSGSNSTFMTRVQDLTADSNNIAGESCLYVYAQEQSGCYGVNAISGTEATIAAIGPGSQNAMIYDFVASNPSNGPKQQQRLAGIYIDSRDGPAMKTVLHGTITPYNNPGSSAVVPAGLAYVGGGNITIESVHTENALDGISCDGDLASGTKANCFILSTDPATGMVALETNTVHIGSQANSYFVNTIKGASMNAALQDDTIVTGLGNCNSGQSLCYTQNGSYQAGTPDAGTARTRIPSAPLQTTYIDGPLFLSSAGNGLAGSVGFLTGNDVSGGWPTTNVATIEAPPTPIPVFTSYHITLPAGASSGVLQGSNTASGLVTGTFSGDSNHRYDAINQTMAQSPVTICPTSPAGTCGVAGLYRVSGYIVSSATCTNPLGSKVGVILSWTDASSAKSSKDAPLITDASNTSLAQTITLGTTGTHYGYFNVVIWSQGSAPIQIGTGNFGGCTMGQAKYDLHAAVEQLR